MYDDPLWIVANGILAQSCFIYKIYLSYICTRQERKLYYSGSLVKCVRFALQIYISFRLMEFGIYI